VEAKVRIAGEADASALAGIVRAAFGKVAQQFELTKANAPTHPSNCEKEWIQRDMQRGLDYYLLAIGEELVGCYGLDRGRSSEASFQRLAVLPSHQGRGLGQLLVRHALQVSLAAGAQSVKVSIIAQHCSLARWYRRLGFMDVERRRFDQLPFEVLYLRYSLAVASTDAVAAGLHRGLM
jgi:ribosomal protein S18 acetylase RimI-like enzyme